MPIFLSVICLAFIVFSLAEAVAGAQSPVGKSVSEMALGAAFLLVLHVFEYQTGFSMPITAETLGASLILGVPGVLLLAGLNRFFL